MKTYVYPAFFRHLESGTYSIDFPDLPGCVSAGDNLEEAYQMAKEALSLHLYGMLEDNESLPAPATPESLAGEENSFIALVEGRPDLVAAEIRNRSVKKTLTLPYWLNEEAERLHINFSQVLQEAVKAKVNG